MKIILAIDGSTHSAVAFDLLARLPWPAESEVTVLTVVEDLRDALGFDADDSVDAVHDELLGAASALVTDWAERVTELGLSARTEVRTGPAPDEIVRAAEESAADLLVLGSHGERGAKRFLLGSVCQAVVTAASCSVLVVRRREGAAGEGDAPALDDIVRVLFATDGSESAGSAAQELVRLAGRPWANLAVLMVLPLITLYGMDVRQRLTASWRLKRMRATQALERAATELAPIATHVDTELHEAADVSEMILDRAEALDTDLICVGSTGRRGLARLVLGSVSARVVSHARCSVWVGRG